MNSIKHFAVLVFLCTLLGCSGASDGPAANSSGSSGGTSELKAGGIYASKNEEGKCTLTKILVLEDSAVHCRFYSEEFDDLPSSVSSADLTFMIGHVPMAREGFEKTERILITVETVSDDELDGYRMYLEAMNRN